MQAANWVNLYTSLGGKSFGYEKARVTPYMHAMVYHVPRFMERNKGVKKFTGQGNVNFSPGDVQMSQLQYT